MVLLGEPAVILPDGSRPRLGGKVVALLAYVVLEGDLLRRRSVAGLLWPDADEGRARDNLRLTLHRLRKHLGVAADGWLVVDRQHLGVRRDKECLTVDVHELLSGELEVEAVGPLADIVPKGCPEYSAWWTMWAERVRATAITQLRDAGGEALAAGDPGRAAALGRRLLASDDLAEAGHELSVRASLATGNRDEARRLVARCTTLFRERLGVEPPVVITALIDQRPDTANRDLGNRGLPLATRPLPTPLTPFTGRDAEVATLVAAIEQRSSRLLSLIGPGGSGKTRLALEVARRTARCFDEGAVMVPLDRVRRASQIAAAIGAALGWEGVDMAANPLVDLCRRLADREVLIVADNVEHLLPDDAAAILSTITRRCPWVVVLCTTRRRLGVMGEDAHALAGLSYPDEVVPDMERYDAVKLLVDRLHRVDKRVRLEPDTAVAIRDICALVGGSPLGLELAASATSTQTLAEVAATLATAPADLPAALRGVPARHATLASVFAHTLALLEDRDRDVVIALAIFRGGFTSEHASAVVGADPPTMARLSAASLVDREPSGRYRMHELIWQLASASLAARGDHDELARQHSHRYLGDLVAAAETLNRSGAAKLIEQLDADRANIEAAWETAVAAGDERRLRAASAGVVSWSANAGGAEEALRMVQAAAALTDDPAARARWLLREATLVNMNAPDLDTVEPPLLAGRELAGRVEEDSCEHADLRARFDLLWGVQLAELDSRFGDSEETLRRAKRTAERVEDAVLSAFIELRLGYNDLNAGRFERAETLMAGAEQALLAAGHVRGAAVCRKGLAHVRDERFDLWEAYQRILTAIERVETLGNRVWRAHAAELHADVLVRLGLHDAGVAEARRVIKVLRAAGVDTHTREALMVLGKGLLAMGHDDAGERAMAASVRALGGHGAANARRYRYFTWSRFLLRRGRWAEAEAAAAELVGLNERIGNHPLAAAGRILLAEAAIGEGRTQTASEALAEAWPVIEAKVECLLDPLDTLAECQRIATVLGDDTIASQAHQLADARLRSVAASITDPDVVRAFLDSAPARTVRAQAP